MRVIEHVYLARQCPVCERRRVPPPELDGAVVGRARLGVNLVSLIVTLREEARLPLVRGGSYGARIRQSGG